MSEPGSGLLDTSVFVAVESGRQVNRDRLPDESYVSVVTRAELHAGVLAARDAGTRSARLATLDTISGLELLTIDAAAASHWATLRVQLAETGRRVNVNDLWIAAVALANGLPVVTQGADFEPLRDLGGLRVTRI